MEALETLVHALKDAFGKIGLGTAVRTVSEQWEGNFVPDVAVVLSTGLGNAEGPTAEASVSPLDDGACELDVEVTLPARLVTMPPAQLWARAKEVVGMEVGISGVQRYFRGETPKTVHISLDSNFVLDYWFELTVPRQEDEDAAWAAFEESVGQVVESISQLLRLADESTGGRQ